jgi:hypothetical protein
VLDCSNNGIRRSKIDFQYGSGSVDIGTQVTIYTFEIERAASMDMNVIDVHVNNQCFVIVFNVEPVKHNNCCQIDYLIAIGQGFIEKCTLV